MDRVGCVLTRPSSRSTHRKLHRQGQLVSASTDDPVQFAEVVRDDPLWEELVNLGRHHGFSRVDQAEVAEASVAISGWDNQVGLERLMTVLADPCLVPDVYGNAPVF